MHMYIGTITLARIHIQFIVFFQVMFLSYSVPNLTSKSSVLLQQYLNTTKTYTLNIV